MGRSSSHDCSWLALVVLLSAVMWISSPQPALAILQNKKELGSEYWYQLGLEDLEEAMKRTVNTRTAKNVILFLGDGMGPAVVTAGRIFKGQQEGKSGEEGYLVFDRLPNTALLKTYNVDKQVPDSAATATAYLSGVKGNFYTLGVTANVKKWDCAASLKEQNKAPSILAWAQQQDKETGLVTTTRVTHATPSASYAASANRDWECDQKLKAENGDTILDCKDLARQLVEDLPGRKLKVILAGGRQPMGAQLPNSTSTTCKRQDGRNMAKEWKQKREAEGVSSEYVTNTKELLELDLEKIDHVMGLFAESNMDYEQLRDKSAVGQPSLSQMTEAAIKRLSRSEKGFVLLVEGGRIDHALHDGKAQLALQEVVAFDEAIRKGMSMVDLKETLIVVTADHSHGLTMNGYQDRGHDILGTTRYEDGVTDNMEYTTLMFSSGPGYDFHVLADGDKAVRRNLSGMDTHAVNFTYPSTVPTKVGWSMHGGEDVAVYADGPWAHLFHRVHEQSYVAHVIGYSARIGPYAGEAGNRINSYSVFCKDEVLNDGAATIAPGGVFLVALVVAVISSVSRVNLSRSLF